MEKLRELLNEFDPYIQKDGEHRDNLWYGVICGESAIFTKEIGIQKIISKEYKFIQRLVREGKIDFDKLKSLTGVTEIMLATNYPNGIKAKRRYRLYEQLTMLLSIQDNPIEFLISVLK